MVEDLFKLKLSSLQKKYGGSTKDDTWTLDYTILGLTSVVLSVHLGRYSNIPVVSVHWETITLIMSTELHITYDTHPTKVRWFMRWLEKFAPGLKAQAPAVFSEANEYAYRVESEALIKEEEKNNGQQAAGSNRGTQNRPQ